MLRDLTVVVFAMLSGFTLSGIAANLYRLVPGKAAVADVGTAHIAVMVVAGPNLLLERAANSRRAKACSRLAFWLASAVAGYWSFVLGLFALNLALALHT